MKRKIMRFLGLISSKIKIPYTRKVSLQEIEHFNNCRYHVVLTKTKWCLTNLFIKGKYKHAAIVTEDGKFVVEATTHGVRITNIESFLKNKSSYLILKMLGMTIREEMLIEEVLYKYIGRPYDWLFFWEESSLYCSELVALIYNHARKGVFDISGRILKPSELINEEVQVMYYANY